LVHLVLVEWLNNFAYKIKLAPAPFLISELIVLAVALITVASQTLKAAVKIPLNR